MPLLSRKGVLAIAAVIDVALQTQGRPISAKTLAARHGLPPRHLESVLQALVRDGILKGIRGPRGGYELARDRRGVSANDILRAAGTVDAGEQEPGSELISKVVIPFRGTRARTSVEPHQAGRHDAPGGATRWLRQRGQRRLVSRFRSSHHFAA